MPSGGARCLWSSPWRRRTAADMTRRSRTLYARRRDGCRPRADADQVHYPRLSYLPFLLPELQAFFSSELVDPNATVSHAWFSFEDVPLKWYYPVGLLYDLFSGAVPIHSLPTRPTGGDQAQGRDEASLPWHIVLHFSDHPAEQLVQMDQDGGVIHDSFVNNVKEADFLRNGTGDAIMKLSREESIKLWESVRNCLSPRLLRSPDPAR